VPDSYHIYTADDYGTVVGEANMMQEIYQHGPISCGIVATSDLVHNYKGGIYTGVDDPDQEINHEVSIVGWGVERGQKYWIIRNSWGSAWGEHGFFRLARGINGGLGNLLIESECSWVKPTDTWTNDVRHTTTEAEKTDPMNADYVKNGPYPVRPPSEFLVPEKE
jgi:cathepsin X